LADFNCAIELDPGDDDYRDGPGERRVGFVDDFGGKIEPSTQQLRNLITLLVSEEFWLITGL
jgi:hypothetical protein